MEGEEEKDQGGLFEQRPINGEFFQWNQKGTLKKILEEQEKGGVT